MSLYSQVESMRRDGYFGRLHSTGKYQEGSYSSSHLPQIQSEAAALPIYTQQPQT